MSEEDAQKWVRGIIKAEMARRDIGYAELTARLGLVGVHDNERNVRNKVARGTFSATFFMQCLKSLGVRSLQIDASKPSEGYD